MDGIRFREGSRGLRGALPRSAAKFVAALMLALTVLSPAAWPEGAWGPPLEASPSQHLNQLSNERSPYLLEHEHDLVDWNPWGPPAFAKAQKEHKLIFLSVGYASCHWCHVMQKVDFEDPDVARMLNQTFVAILVDREERPDVDREYLAVCEMLTGSGGWPLNVIMTPDRIPFFAANFIPKRGSPGSPGMLDLIPRIERVWKNDPEEFLKGGKKLEGLLRGALDRSAPGQALGLPILLKGCTGLSGTFDSANGGFGGAPKFPPFLDVLFLLRYRKRTGDPKALEMAEKTLAAMRRGGVYDQVGFGFHRYAVDDAWRIPHFEKMLPDQALAAMSYTEAYQATGNPIYGRVAREIFTYVLRDLTSSQGAFYDGEDADSEGEEGKFYLWTKSEIRQALDREDAGLMVDAYGVRDEGNFPAASKGENILSLRAPIAQLAAQRKTSAEELEKRLESAREKLWRVRRKRPRPRRDEKILAGWNGLMVAAFAKGAQAFQDPEYRQAARRATDFLLKNLRAPDGRLLHAYAGGVASLPANLDDYAFLAWGLIELYEADFQVRDLEAALALQGELARQFWDGNGGGFFFTALGDKDPLLRQKSFEDIDLPAGNAVAALNLFRLADLTGDTGLEAKGLETERSFSAEIAQSPSDFPAMLMAADFYNGPSYEVVIAGDPQAPDTRAMLSALMSPFLPNKVVLLRPTRGAEITRLAPYTSSQTAIGGKATAYVCVKYSCKLPTTDAGKMLELLGVKRR